MSNVGSDVEEVGLSELESRSGAADDEGGHDNQGWKVEKDALEAPINSEINDDDNDNNNEITADTYKKERLSMGYTGSGGILENVGGSRDAGDATFVNNGEGGDVDENKQKVVVVELPQPLLKASPASKMNSTGADQRSTGSLSSVHEMESLDIHSTATGAANGYNNNSEDESWSHVSQYKHGDCGSSVASASHSIGSTMTGEFVNLSLNGTCPRCSFLTRQAAGFCGGCGIALTANPCMSVDEQIALNLQHKEEQLAMQELQSREKKRRALSQQPILDRSRALVDDIESFVKSWKGRGCAALPGSSMVVLASRFIEFANDKILSNGAKVTLAYHFSPKLNFGIGMEQIRQNGLGSHAPVSTNIEVAYNSPGDSKRHLRLNHNKASGLFSIPEKGQKDTDIDASSSRLGWIVATVEEGIDFRTSSASATVRSIARSEQSLPLVSFDASMRNNKIIERLLNGLSQVCCDFFDISDAIMEQDQIEALIRANADDRCAKKARVMPSSGAAAGDDGEDSLSSLRKGVKEAEVSSSSASVKPPDDIDTFLKSMQDFETSRDGHLGDWEEHKVSEAVENIGFKF